MLILSLDLSSARGSLALHENGKCIGEHWLGEDYSHSEKVIDAVRELLGGRNLREIDRWVTTSGPGSFTGLRIAMATLKAFSMAMNKPIEVLSGSEARALAWRAQNPDAAVKEIKVYTRAAAGKFTEEVFALSPGGETIELYEEKFPLRARYLGEHREKANSRKTHSTPEEWIALSPQYFGDTRFS